MNGDFWKRQYKQYEHYYKEGIYERRYADINLRAQKELLLAAGRTRTRLGNTTLTIWDFGAGNGRFLPVFEQIAEVTGEVEVIAYDISLEALKAFEHRLQSQNYQKTSEGTKWHELLVEDKEGYVGAAYKKDNLTIRFVHGNVNGHYSDLVELIGNVDMTCCMFGSLAHIPGRENRQNTLRMFGRLTRGDVVVSLPNLTPRKAASLEAFEKYRVDANPRGLAKESRDIYYQSIDPETGGGVCLYQHVYSFEEFCEDCKVARLPMPRIEVETISSEAELTSSSLTEEERIQKLQEDASNAASLSKEDAEKQADYFLGITKGINRDRSFELYKSR